MLGMLGQENQIQATLPDKDLSKYAQVKWQFMLCAPFEIAQQCCRVMKKTPSHTYMRRTGRMPITASMASESRLRTQAWLKNGCNGFDLKSPVSNPMAFWFEQDVLLYIVENQIPYCSAIYGDIVPEDGQQLKLGCSEYGVMDLERPYLVTTGAARTGCMFCGFGCHLEKGEGRFERLKRTHPAVYNYLMKPVEEGGLGYKEIIDWLNENGNLHIKY